MLFRKNSAPSPEAEKLLNSRRLWDFMEDIPEDQDPRQVCRGLVEEFLRKAEREN